MTETAETLSPLRLLRDFPEPDRQEWRAAAEALLKGAPFEKRLLTRTYEGLTLEPLYDASSLEGIPHLDTLPGTAPYLRGSSPEGYLGAAWEVAQELAEPDPAAFNAAALHDLAQGQNALTVLLDRATLEGVDPDEAHPGEVGGRGLSLATVDDLATALDGIDPTRVPVYLEAPTEALPVLSLLIALARRRQLDPSALRGGVATDPLGSLAAEGRHPGALSWAYDRMAHTMRWARDHAPELSTVTVHGDPWSDGGAHAVQELAFVAATTAEYLREMSARGVPVADAAPRLRLSLSLGSNLFLEVAKVRAARLVHARIVEAFGGDAEARKVRIHGRTARYNRSILDPYVNLLRGTTAAFAGILGGVDSLHVGCWDELIRVPDAASRRMARNTQLVLREEAHLTGVIDPAGGSWAVEHLTDRVGRAAWSLFQEIEGRGGMGAALAEGHPQALVAATREARRERAATRKDVQVGVNMYADPGEVPASPAAGGSGSGVGGGPGLEEAIGPLERLAASLDADPSNVVEAAAAAAEAGATLGEISRTLRGGDDSTTEVEAVPAVRQAEPFEALRRRVARHAEDAGGRPRVFLAKLGPVGQHRARAEFTTGFMEVAGFQVESGAGFADPEEAGRAAAASGAPVVAICSSDDVYPDGVPPLVKALRETAPETVVLLAGRPPDHVEALQEAGVDHFVHLGADAVELHSRILDRLGIPS